MSAVYVFGYEDPEADSWHSEAAVVASSAADAVRTVRAAGMHKRRMDNQGRPIRVLTIAEVPEAGTSSRGIAYRRADDSGWTAWAPLLDSEVFRHR